MNDNVRRQMAEADEQARIAVETGAVAVVHDSLVYDADEFFQLYGPHDPEDNCREHPDRVTRAHEGTDPGQVVPSITVGGVGPAYDGVLTDESWRRLKHYGVRDPYVGLSDEDRALAKTLDFARVYQASPATLHKLAQQHAFRTRSLLCRLGVHRPHRAFKERVQPMHWHGSQMAPCVKVRQLHECERCTYQWDTELIGRGQVGGR